MIPCIWLAVFVGGIFIVCAVDEFDLPPAVECAGLGMVGLGLFWPLGLVLV